MKKGCTAFNKRYTQIALFGQFGLDKTPVGRALSAGTPFVGFCSTTFFCARKNATHFSSSGTKKRRIPRTLNDMQFLIILIEKKKKFVDRIKKAGVL